MLISINGCPSSQLLEILQNIDNSKIKNWWLQGKLKTYRKAVQMVERKLMIDFHQRESLYKIALNILKTKRLWNKYVL